MDLYRTRRYSIAIACVGLGSNLGNRQAQIRGALNLLQRDRKVHILRRSSLYETDPVGIIDQPLFLNSVVQIFTEYTPRDLLALLQAIERRLDRRKTLRWGPRRIDLDLLLYDDQVIQEPDLIVPHPELAKRAFVLVPLVEIGPHIVHPLLGKTVAELLEKIDHREGIRLYHGSRISKND